MLLFNIYLTFRSHLKHSFTRTLSINKERKMNTQFCRVGKIKPNLSSSISLKEIEKRVANFVDDTTKVIYPEDLNVAF